MPAPLSEALARARGAPPARSSFADDGRPSGDRSPRRPRARLVALAAVALAAVATVAAVLLGSGSSSKGSQATGIPPGDTTATVERRTLVEHAQENGTLGYGATAELYDRVAGTFTWLPGVGAAIGRGAVAECAVLLCAFDERAPFDRGGGVARRDARGLTAFARRAGPEQDGGHRGRRRERHGRERGDSQAPPPWAPIAARAAVVREARPRGWRAARALQRLGERCGHQLICPRSGPARSRHPTPMPGRRNPWRGRHRSPA